MNKQDYYMLTGIIVLTAIISTGLYLNTIIGQTITTNNRVMTQNVLYDMEIIDKKTPIEERYTDRFLLN